MVSDSKNNDLRRAYWTEQMEAAFAFMGRILDYPVLDCGEPLESLQEAALAAGVGVQFSQSRIAGQHERLFYLRAGLIRDFIAVAKEMNARGWTLKVEDGFRSRAMQQHIALHNNVLDIVLRKVVWENHGKIPDPELLFRRLSALIATCPKIGTHMSGSAIDISVLRTKDLSEVMRGAPYLELSELTPMASPFVSDEATRNRVEISRLMRSHGFVAYPYEFWHYSKGDAYDYSLNGLRSSARYGAVDFDRSSGQVTPIMNPCESLHSMEDIQRHIGMALERIKLDEQG